MKYLLGELKYYINSLLTNDVKRRHIKELREYGITVIPDFLSGEECKSHRECIDNAILKNNISWSDESESDIRIMGYENVEKMASNLFNEISYIYHNYIDVAKQNSFLMANRVAFKDNNKGSGGGWHRDSLNRRQLKFMIYLNDVDAGNGAFEYVPKTHTAKSKFRTNHFLNQKVRYTDIEMEDYKKKFPSKLYTAKGGTCVVFDSSGLHRGTPLKRKDSKRYAITKYMFDGKIPQHIQKLIIKND